jgi:hypothetical protein
VEAVARHWSWQTAPEQYARLFGEIGAVLARRLGARAVLFAARCVDDEELEQELRSAAFQLEPPRRRTRWIATISYGSLNAWRVVALDEAATTPEPLWGEIFPVSVYCCAATEATGFDRWADVEAFVAAQPAHLVSHDPDCVTIEAPQRSELEAELIAAARSAAERAGGGIKELERRGEDQQ